MKIFGQIIRTVVNTVALPVCAVKDVMTLGGIATKSGKSATIERIKKLKDEAGE